MSLFLSPIGNGQQFFDANGVPLNAGLINTYQAGSTTPQATYTTSAGITQNANPIVLGADGRTPNEIWFTSGVAYKFILTDSLSNVLGTYDNLSGINDTSSAPLTEWVASGLTPTYISATSFSVTGNQTLVFQVNQRVKTTNTGGTIYSSVSTSTYSGGSGLTTIVVVNDSGTLDSGISSVSYGFTNPTYPSIGVVESSLSCTGNAATSNSSLSSGIPQNSQSTAYTTVLADANKHILHPTADNNPRTFTIDSNANVAYPIGTTITFVNQINTLTIAITSDTLTLAGVGSTGSRTLNASGMATALKTGTTTWKITGSGIS